MWGLGFKGLGFRALVLQGNLAEYRLWVFGAWFGAGFQLPDSLKPSTGLGLRAFRVKGLGFGAFGV